MKKIFQLALGISLITNFSFGQTIIEGNFSSFPKKSFSIKVDQSSLNDYAAILIGHGETNDEGNFTSTLNLESGKPVTFYIDRIFLTLWIEPNTVLTIHENANGQYTFAGTTAKENSFLYETKLMQPYRVTPNIGTDKYEPQKIVNYLDSIENQRLFSLNELVSTCNISKRFISYANAEIRAYTFSEKDQYPARLKAMNKIADEDINDHYFDFWRQFSINEDSSASVTYQVALQNYIGFKTLEKVGKSEIGKELFWREYFKIIDNLLVSNPFSLQKQRTSAILFLIKYFNFTDLASSEIERYKKQFPNSVSIPIIENLWQKKIGSTNTTPSFRLKNVQGEWVNIEDFRGKVVYIDFWGSWCQACIISMPHAELLKQKFKTKDVIFLYIDFFDTREQWLNAIKKYKIDGLHLKAEKTEEEYFKKVFNINQGFPRYALIDKNGKLVTISAPRPRDESAYNLIQEYLNK